MLATKILFSCKFCNYTSGSRTKSVPEATLSSSKLKVHKVGTDVETHRNRYSSLEPCSILSKNRLTLNNLGSKLAVPSWDFASYLFSSKLNLDDPFSKGFTVNNSNKIIYYKIYTLLVDKETYHTLSKLSLLPFSFVINF